MDFAEKIDKYHKELLDTKKIALEIMRTVENTHDIVYLEGMLAGISKALFIFDDYFKNTDEEKEKKNGK
jgi:hypothetical protein